jgi:HTH-type transcriptional regulator/antitoxin HigA
MQKDLQAKSKGSDELEILSILIKEHENKQYPVPKPNPLEAIKFRLEQMNMSESELSEILWYRSRKSEILTGKAEIKPGNDQKT